MEGLRVLVVDDEPDMGEFVADALEALEHGASLAHDKSSFADLIKSGPDVVMLDLFLPDCDGVELLHLMKAEGSNSAVIFMSGKDQSILNAAQRLATDQGITVLGTLQKPFTLDDLSGVIQRYKDKVGNWGKTTPFAPSENDIVQGLGAGQFDLLVRPQLKLEHGAIVGGEAALKWNHPVRGGLLPNSYMSDPDAGFAFNALTEFTMEAAVRQLGEWNRKGHLMRLSIRIAPRALAELNLTEKLENLVRSEQVNPYQVVLEFPEAAVKNELDDHIDQLTRLRIKGFTLSVCKFGTGNMSLWQLVRAPFNELKLHRSIISDLAKGPEVRSFVRASILVAHDLDMDVVGAGVRDRAALGYLTELRCDFVQGELIGDPTDPASLLSTMKASHVPTELNEAVQG